MNRYDGTVLEGSKGMAVAAILATAVAALAVAQWVVLPEQVVMHVGLTGQADGYAPKWLPLLASTGIGLFGTAWFAREGRAAAGRHRRRGGRAGTRDDGIVLIGKRSLW